MTRTIEAPLTQTIGGVTYNFVGWSDGGAAKHSIDTPSANTTYTANYQTTAALLSAAYVSNAPATVLAGQSVDYQVTVTNTGSQTWLPTGTNLVNLGVYFAGASDAVGAWPAEPVRFGLTRSVAPGDSFTFNVHITAPTTPGTYVLRDRMVQEYVAWFDAMERINVTVRQKAETYSSTPPTVWAAGQPQDYSITLTNNGATTWHAAGTDRVRLGVYFGGSSDGTPIGANAPTLYTLPHDIQPGESVTIKMTVIGPSSPGNYILRNRLYQDNYGWFSEMLRTSVSVEKLSAQYIVCVPTKWHRHQTQTFSVTLVNNGTKTWNANGTNLVQLGVYFDGNSDAIGDWKSEPQRFHLSHDVPPGARITLKITVHAPCAPGHHVLRLRMVKENVNWFNSLQSRNVCVR
jgi:archaellum component FlaF (FlaF/FlaG flagellin family)